MSARTLGMLAVVLGAAACTVEAVDDESVDATSRALSMSAEQATLVLQLVNDPATDLPLLDDEIGLDARAAKNILAHRGGADGVYPSSDDDAFDTLAELDALAYVADTALLALRDYAVAHAPPPPELVEGVQLTSAQVAAVLWGVNQATVEELDLDVGLASNAAANLIAGRPYAKVAAMGAVANVGPSALAALRDYAVVWSAEMASGATSQAGTYDGVAFDAPTADAALAAAQTATQEQLVGAGMPKSGAVAIVAHRPYATLAQVSAAQGVGPATMTALHAYATSLLPEPEPPTGTVPKDGVCSPTDACLPGLVCAGLSVEPTGYCRPEWMAGTFEDTTDVAIPDNDPQGIERSIEVTGLASVPEDIIVHLDVDHPSPSDLLIVLTQPSSAESIVWQVGSNGAATVVPQGAEYDSMVNGTWTLRVVDTKTGQAGTLRGWSLELTSRYD